METGELPPAPSAQIRPARKVNWKKVALSLLAIYFAPLVFLALNQRLLIFKPHYFSAAQWTAMPLAAGTERIRLRTASGETVPAIFGRALSPDGIPRPDYKYQPTVLYFHGNSAGLMDLDDDFKTFRLIGVNVLMPDYIGFGASTGQPSEHGCYETADAAYRYLRSRPDIDSTQLVIAGHSLGTAVAIDLASRMIHTGQPVDGLALFSGFTSMPAEAHAQYPVYPTWLLRLVVRYPFESERKMPGVTCPVLIVHSRSDGTVPYWMSDRLAAACRGPVTRLTIDNIPHGQVFSAKSKRVIPVFESFLVGLDPSPKK